jgi:putative hydrolase of the HAD superfamily
VDPEIVEIIKELRSAGVVCCLATNQEAARHRHMSAMSEYRSVLDHQFYSCELGFCKPDPRYFEAILQRLGRSAEEVLFIDDREPNTAAAASIGIRVETFTPPPGTPAVDEMRRVLRAHGLHRPRGSAKAAVVTNR